MCRNAPVRDPELMAGADATHFTRVCDGTGDMPECALCPSSLTYWQLTADPPNPTPYANRGGGESVIQEAPDWHPNAIDWKTPVEITTPGGAKVYKAWDYVPLNQAKPCTFCLQPTVMISPRGVYVHKACAEEYLNGRRKFAEPR